MHWGVWVGVCVCMFVSRVKTGVCEGRKRGVFLSYFLAFLVNQLGEWVGFDPTYF